MFLFRDPVSLLQAFGYGIALAGLLYYKLGAEQLKEYLSKGGMAWSEFGNNRPAARKMLVFAMLLVTIFILLGGLAPRLAPEATANALGEMGTWVGEKGA